MSRSHARWRVWLRLHGWFDEYFPMPRSNMSRRRRRKANYVPKSQDWAEEPF